MPSPIDFYFDFSSPYGYFASTRIDELAAHYGRNVTWRPILLGIVFRVTGMQPLAQVPIKGNYSLRDMKRSARLYRIPLNLPQTFPIGSVVPARAFYWLSDRDEGQSKALAQALLRAYFVDNRDISDAGTVLDVAAATGVDRTQLGAALADPAVKERLKGENEKALARGVFGSPFFVVDEEPFWGMDRLDHVEHWLKTGGW